MYHISFISYKHRLCVCVSIIHTLHSEVCAQLMDVRKIKNVLGGTTGENGWGHVPDPTLRWQRVASYTLPTLLSH